MKGGEIMAEKQKTALGYSGKIGNAGSQKVEAPFAQKSTAKGTVKKGEDLRNQ
jgi:hypothetical protein